MADVWDDASIDSRANLLVLLALADFSNDAGYSWPAIETLALKARCSQRSVQQIIAGLVKDGKLEIEYNKGPNGVNKYKLLTPRRICTPQNLHPASSGSVVAGGGVQVADCQLHPNRQEPSVEPSGTTTFELFPEPQSNSGKEVQTLPRNLQSKEFKEAWAGWLEDRKERKKKVTPRAAKIQLGKLSEWGEAKALQAIENAIAGGWVGLFEPKEESSRNGNGYRNDDRSDRILRVGEENP
jgi:hypothetical protein